MYYLKNIPLRTFCSSTKPCGFVGALRVQTYQAIQIFVRPLTCCPLLSLLVTHVLSLITSSPVTLVSLLEVLQTRIPYGPASPQAASHPCVSVPPFSLHLDSFLKSPRWSISRVTQSPRPHRHSQPCQPLESC